MDQHQTAACIRTNLFKKILVCILFPKEKGRTRISENFSCKLNLRDVVHFHWNWMPWHQGGPQERNSKCCSPTIHIELVMKSCTTTRFQVRRERGDGAGKEFLWITDQNQKLAIKILQNNHGRFFPSALENSPGIIHQLNGHFLYSASRRGKPLQMTWGIMIF